MGFCIGFAPISWLRMARAGERYEFKKVGMETRTETASGVSRRPGASFLADRQFVFLVLTNILVFGLAVMLAGSDFVGAYNLQSMAAQLPELGLLALGVMLAMVSGNGGIDLSGIALANLSGVLAGLLASHFISADEAPMFYTCAFIALALLAGGVGGMLNGALIAWCRLTPILATLGTQLFFTGVAVVLTNGSALRLGYIEPLDAFGNSTLGGVPICFMAFLAIAAVLAVMLKRTPFGIRLYLLGSKAKAARYAGIPVQRMLFLTYTVCGLLSGMAGAVIAARTSSVKWDYGSSYVMISILIVVAAGVRPEGGYGRLICVLLSAMALQLLASMFNFLDVSSFFRDCAWGAMLLVFLVVSRFDYRTFFRIRRPGSDGPASLPRAGRTS